MGSALWSSLGFTLSVTTRIHGWTNMLLHAGSQFDASIPLVTPGGIKRLSSHLAEIVRAVSEQISTPTRDRAGCLSRLRPPLPGV